MTTGIYYIYWEQEDSKVYIGYSQNIENRLKAHLYAMKRGAHDSNKVQKMYNTYNTTKMVTGVLEVCKVEELRLREINWISEFNSINIGLNHAVGGEEELPCI